MRGAGPQEGRLVVFQGELVEIFFAVPHSGSGEKERNVRPSHAVLLRTCQRRFVCHDSEQALEKQLGRTAGRKRRGSLKQIAHLSQLGQQSLGRSRRSAKKRQQPIFSSSLLQIQRQVIRRSLRLSRSSDCRPRKVLGPPRVRRRRTGIADCKSFLAAPSRRRTSSDLSKASRHRARDRCLAASPLRQSEAEQSQAFERLLGEQQLLEERRRESGPLFARDVCFLSSLHPGCAGLPGEALRQLGRREKTRTKPV